MATLNSCVGKSVVATYLWELMENETIIAKIIHF